MRYLLLVLVGCSSVFGLHEPARLADATSDDATDGSTADAAMCFGAGEYTVCFDALPADPATFMGMVDTGTAAVCATTVHWTSAAQPDTCFLVGTDVALTNLTLVGARPAVVVATGRVTFGGLIDASSHHNNFAEVAGAGAGSPACGTPGVAQVDNNGGGGGAGGSYGSLGGNGGNSSTGLAGGTAAAAGAIATLHGGCSGEPGARGGGGQSGAAGVGGGALYIVAGTEIALGTSTVAVNGSGANAAINRWGGSGGGAGGMLVLHAPAITASAATLMANGGGGASGAGGGAGTPGSDPSTSAPHSPAPGGSGAASGGNGYALSAAATDGAASTGGTLSGGGGGGGGGTIRANVPITGADASPPIDISP